MIAQADAVKIPLPDKSIHCCVTSPPYWGLRKYAGDQGEEPLGLEPTPERHVERIVEIFREVRRVLRDDGVVWLNYGDCYAGNISPAKKSDVDKRKHEYEKGGRWEGFRGNRYRENQSQAIFEHQAPQGSLMMMPHRVALALQVDGWIVRQDLVWFKRNPMPESVNGWRWQREREKKGRSEHARKHNIKGGTEAMLRDASIHKGIGPDWVPEYEYGDDLELRKGSWRHTRAHEYVFMLVKKMQYWSNQEAVRESIQSGPSDIRKMEQGLDRIGGKNKELIDPLARASATTNLGRKRAVGDPSGRNPRSVLDVPTAPYKGAHYATFPPNLIAPLIRATCPRWACPVCGQGRAAVVEDNTPNTWHDERTDKELQGTTGLAWGSTANVRTLGYRPTCSHEHTQEEARPGVVFDPFVGSGTTIAVAKGLLRRGIGIDISMEYLDLQAKVRIGQGSPSNQLDGLPLFSDIESTPPTNKQDAVGKRTYTGFNARWKDKHK